MTNQLSLSFTDIFSMFKMSHGENCRCPEWALGQKVGMGRHSCLVSEPGQGKEDVPARDSLEKGVSIRAGQGSIHTLGKGGHM